MVSVSIRITANSAYYCPGVDEYRVKFIAIIALPWLEQPRTYGAQRAGFARGRMGVFEFRLVECALFVQEVHNAFLLLDDLTRFRASPRLLGHVAKRYSLDAKRDVILYEITCGSQKRKFDIREPRGVASAGSLGNASGWVKVVPHVMFHARMGQVQSAYCLVEVIDVGAADDRVNVNRDTHAVHAFDGRMSALESAFGAAQARFDLGTAGINGHMG